MKQNPWGITESEARAIEAMIEFGSLKGAARGIGVPYWTLNGQLVRVRSRMTAVTGRKTTPIACYVLWDRWVREQAKQ